MTCCNSYPSQMKLTRTDYPDSVRIHDAGCWGGRQRQWRRREENLWELTRLWIVRKLTIPRNLKDDFLVYKNSLNSKIVIRKFRQNGNDCRWSLQWRLRKGQTVLQACILKPTNALLWTFAPTWLADERRSLPESEAPGFKYSCSKAY